MGLYNSDIHYPDSAFQSFIIPKVTMDSGRLTWIIPLEKHGIYAISILDDENNNGKMDYRLGFLPREGFGFSNNPGIKTLSVPAYNTVSFPFNGGRKIISVNMVYIL